VRVVEGKNPVLRRALEHRYFAWPSAEDNAVLRLARQRLLGGASARALPTAAAQQGLIQMVRDFCDQSNATCKDCRLPALVRDWCGRGLKSAKSDKVVFLLTGRLATAPG
jgi:hypothetical protein